MSATAGPVGTGRTPLWRRAGAMEAAGWVSTARWLGRRPRVRPEATAVAYVGGLRAVLTIVVVLSAVEVAVLDLILRDWFVPRVVALVLGVWGLLFMVGMATGLTVNPHEVGPHGLRLRSGALVTLELPWADVEHVALRRKSYESNRSVLVEPDDDGDEVSIPVQNLTALQVRLSEPVHLDLPDGRRAVRTVNFAADDPPAALRAVREHMPRG